MDKQNEGIQNLSEAGGDLAKYDRLVTVMMRKTGVFIRKNKDVLFLVPKIIRNGLHEVTSYSENYM